MKVKDIVTKKCLICAFDFMQRVGFILFLAVFLHKFLRTEIFCKISQCRKLS